MVIKASLAKYVLKLGMPPMREQKIISFLHYPNYSLAHLAWVGSKPNILVWKTDFIQMELQRDNAKIYAKICAHKISTDLP